MNDLRIARLRGGVTAAELMVSGVVLVALMGIVTPVAVKLGRVSQSARHYRLAVDELSNQAERLTQLEPTACTLALEQLDVSPHLRDALPDAKLSGQMLIDDDGTRVALSLDWNPQEGALPLTLVAWMAPETSVNDRSPSDEPEKRGTQP